MIKLRNAVLALATGLLATGALAQHFTQDSDSATVAEELFGSGASVKLEFNDFGDADFVPKAKLIFGGTAIAAETEFHVTFTLSRATFAEPVSNRDFMWGSWGPANTDRGGLDCDDATSGDEGDTGVAAGTGDDATKLKFCPEDEVVLERTGGGKNTNTVSFKVTVNDDATIADLAAPDLDDHDDDTTTPDTYEGVTRKIVFVLPNVNAMGLRAPNPAVATDLGGDVTVTTTISQPKTVGTTIMESVKDGHKCGDDVLQKAGVPAGCPVVEAAAVITGVMADVTGAGGMISLAPADERTVLVGGNGKASDPQRAHLATVKVAVADGFGGARDQDGDKIEGFTGDLAGSLSIKVASDGFNDGDVVYIDTNGNKKVDGREAFDMDTGMASDSVPLKAGDMMVYYVPNGEDALKHRTTFTTTASTEFSDTDAKNRSSKAGKASLKLHGIRDGVAQAYAIAPLTSTDTANVRVTCETSAKEGCNVFLDCHDPMGMNTFGETGAMVGPNMTVRWSQSDIAMALGLDDGWEGRLACDVLSSAEISVQVLTRAAGVLVNNTAVNKGGM